MNKLLATVAMIGSMSFAASASADEYATITNVNPNYQNIQVPRYRTDCRVNQVPIYGSVKNGQASTGDTIVGAIIGDMLCTPTALTFIALVMDAVTGIWVKADAELLMIIKAATFFIEYIILFALVLVLVLVLVVY